MEKSKSTFYYMWKMIQYKPGLYALNCMLWIIIHVSLLIPGLITKEFFEVLTGHASLNKGVWGLMALFMTFTLVRVTFITLGARTDILHRFNMSALIRRNLLESILKKPGAKALQCSTGEALNSFRGDVDQAENAISWTLDAIGTVVFAAAAISILFSINVKITLFVFAPLVLVIVTAQKASERIEKYRIDSRKATSHVSGTIGDMFSFVQAIKTAGAEKNILEHLNKLNRQRHYFTLKDTILGQLLYSIYENTVGLGTSFILLLAGQSIRAGSFSVGDFALFVYYLTFVTDFTQFFGGFLAHYKQTGVAFERMISILEAEDGDPLVQHKPLYLKAQAVPREEIRKLKDYEKLDTLEVNGLTYEFEGGGRGIQNVSFSIKRGEFVVITGRIGSGKSTLLKTLLGLLPKKAGEIYWNNINIKEPKEFFVPPISAYTSQVPNLFSCTIRENILMGALEEAVDLEKAVYLAVFEEDIRNFEGGLDTVIGPKGVKLSGGQIQRTAAARMYVRETELLVFDDISSALDIETETILWNRLFKDKNATCIAVSNRKQALKQADQIIVMKNGCIEAKGTLNQLLRCSEEMREIYGEQTK